MNYFDAVTDLGLGAALVYRSDAREQRIASTAFWIGLLGAAGLAVLLWFLAPLFASFGPGQETVWLLRVLSLQFPLSALGKVHEYRIRASLDFKSGRPFAVATFVKGGSPSLRRRRRGRVEPRDRPARRHARAFDRAVARRAVAPRAMFSRTASRAC